MELIKGDRLTINQRREVLAVYVHRHLAAAVWPTDAEWLTAHAFYFTKAGRLARNRRYCEPAFLAEGANR